MYQTASLFIAEGDTGLGALGINLPALLFQLLAFAILVGVFARFVYAPVLRTLDRRVAEQREIQENSERIKRQLAEATAESQRARLEGQQQAQQIIAQAKNQADAAVSQAQQRAQAEYDAR